MVCDCEESVFQGRIVFLLHLFLTFLTGLPLTGVLIQLNQMLNSSDGMEKFTIIGLMYLKRGY